MPSTEAGNGHDGTGASIGEDARHVIDALETFSTDLGSAVREHMERRPYVTLGLGFLAGWVLGGGLTLRVGALLLGAAGRAAITGALERAASGGGTALRGGGER